MAYSGQKILLVDDDPAFIEIYSATFNQSGFNFAVAKDGAEALEKAKTEKPDLILLDIMLPDLDGFEVLKRLRQVPETAKTTVWMVTNLAEQLNQTIAASLGATDYLVKSVYTPKQVCEKIQAYFAQGPASESLHPNS
jgi:two-component system alkaline phosphatase synthesis response regulator PhoP